jgi:hypothetical protein
MRNSFSRGLVVGFVTIMLGLGSLFMAHGSGTSDTSGTVALQAIGQSGADAVPLKVWTDKESGQAFREGDRAIISFQAERTAYLTILAVSSDGNVHILFPNKEIPSNLIQQEKVYTLFGDDSSLRLAAGQKSKNAGLVFYLSAKPFSLDPLKAPDDQQYISIPPSARDNINTLKDKLKTVSQEPGFNRIVVPLPGVGGENLEAKPSVLPAQAMEESRKALRGGVESSTPEVLTGAAGLKPLREEGRQR